MVLGFKFLLPVTICGEEMEVVAFYKNLRLPLDKKFDCSPMSDLVYKEVQGRANCIRRSASFNVHNTEHAN